MGFVNRDKTRQLLQNKRSGNFLLRFSESNREGAITFSWVEHTKEGATVIPIAPFTKDELSKWPLADQIKTFSIKNRTDNPLIYLYPDIPMDSAFGRYYSNANEITNSKSVAPYLKKSFPCQGDCPTPPPSSPTHSMELDPDWIDFIHTPPQILEPEFMEAVKFYFENFDTEDKF